MTGDRPRFGPLHNTPRWYLVLAVAWSAVVLSLPWIVVATMGERLPDPVASHWGADGVPDGFTPLATAWVWPAVIGLLLVALLLGLGMAMRQLRSMVSFSLGLATFLGVLGAGTLVAQVDGAAAEASVDAAAAEASVDAALAWSMAAGVAVGISAALLVRRLSPVAAARPTAGNAHSSSPTASPAGARPVPSWTGETRTSRGAVIGGWAAVVPLAVSVAVFVVDRQWVMAGAMLALGAVIGLLMLAFLHATVLVDADGRRRPHRPFRSGPVLRHPRPRRPGRRADQHVGGPNGAPLTRSTPLSCDVPSHGRFRPRLPLGGRCLLVYQQTSTT